MNTVNVILNNWSRSYYFNQIRLFSELNFEIVKIEYLENYEKNEGAENNTTPLSTPPTPNSAEQSSLGERNNKKTREENTTPPLNKTKLTYSEVDKYEYSNQKYSNRTYSKRD